MNRRKLETPVTEYRHTLTQQAVLVSSWVREEDLVKDGQYQCTAVSRAGNDTSKIDIHLSSRDEDSVSSADLNQWRNALMDHENLLQKWKKTWESCNGQGIL